VVVGESNRDALVEFLCIHHGRETRNDRQLEQGVERNPEGKITSCRNRGDTQVNQKLDCKWRCKSLCLRLKPASISHTLELLTMLFTFIDCTTSDSCHSGDTVYGIPRIAIEVLSRAGCLEVPALPISACWYLGCRQQ
jgi:hypothetical protein